jgi:GxxExxY protein
MTTRRIVGLADEALTRSIIAAFFEVYNTLGYGFLESVYAEALARELRRRGHRVEREVSVKVWFKGQLIARQRVDMLVDDKVIVEIKSGLTLPITGSRQLYNYLRGTDKEVGLLLHFGPEPRFYREYCPNSRKDLPDVSDVPVLIRDQLERPDSDIEPAHGMPVDDSKRTVTPVT